MKAQLVKNAVIVPTGREGRLLSQAAAALVQPRRVDRRRDRKLPHLHPLIAVGDRQSGRRQVATRSVVIHDGEDPLFRGRGRQGHGDLLRRRQQIALDRGFWLGDAFASGGSNGYDHKAMGITARGAWVSVQRHFREIGVDVQTQPIRVAGVGDMSGDVFGNGMLLSKALKLVAAFDHRHIFLDPEPDPAASWEERNRLFNLPRSSWADYDASCCRRAAASSRAARSRSALARRCVRCSTWRRRRRTPSP
jgi:glutamate dehydrogenase